MAWRELGEASAPCQQLLSVFGERFRAHGRWRTEQEERLSWYALPPLNHRVSIAVENPRAMANRQPPNSK